MPIKAFFTGKGHAGDLKDIADRLNAPLRDIYLPDQKHTDRVVIIDHDTGPMAADAVITNRTDIFIGVMTARFSSSPTDILMAVGPAIGGCCYEVGPEVAEAVRQVAGGEDSIFLKDSSRHIDLSLANRLQAQGERTMHKIETNQTKKQL